MKVLAIETSTLAGSVALVEDGLVLGEVLSFVRANHSEALLPLIDGVLSRARCAIDQIDVIAVGLGPGSFTGVRIGVALAKGFRLATGKRLAGVSSLDALLAAIPNAHGLVAAVLDGRRGEVFVKVWRVSASTDVVLDVRHGTPDAIGAAVRRACGDAPIAVTGDLDEPTWSRFEVACGGTTTRIPRLFGSPQARFIASEVLAGRCVFDDDDRLEPIYVRASDARAPGAG